LFCSTLARVVAVFMLFSSRLDTSGHHLPLVYHNRDLHRH
jgi:hypothetical protein